MTLAKRKYGVAIERKRHLRVGRELAGYMRECIEVIEFLSKLVADDHNRNRNPRLDGRPGGQPHLVQHNRQPVI
jgi:hypothetical protein